MQRDGQHVTLQIDGITMRGTARGANLGADVTALIRLEQVRVSEVAVENAIKLPLLTCMYLGDRWECLFKRGGPNEVSLRAYAPHKLAAGEYWVQLPQDKLWVF